MIDGRRKFAALAFVALLVGAACAEAPPQASPATPAREPDRDGMPDQMDRAPKPPPPPPSPPPPAGPLAPSPNALTPSPPLQPQPAIPQSGTSSTTAPAATPAEEAPDSPRRREVALRAARTEVEQAKRELDASMGDCAAACRALGSMERATGHLCDLATEHDDRRRCEDAKTAVLRARDKIRASCGACPGGPSLDKSAPIPSRP